MDTPTLELVDIWSFLMYGTGRIMMVASVATLMAPMMVYTTGRLPQTAGTDASQLEASGRQMRKTCRTLPTNQAAMTPRTTQVAALKDRVTKMRR